MIQEWFGYTAPAFPGSEWIGPILGTIIFFYGGSPFLKGAFQEARDRQPGMMLLIGMAITVAFVASAATTLGWFDLDFWWEATPLAPVFVDELVFHTVNLEAFPRSRRYSSFTKDMRATGHLPPRDLSGARGGGIDSKGAP